MTMLITIAQIVAFLRQKSLFISGQVSSENDIKTVGSIVSHSQKVDNLHPFVAIKGAQFDGHEKISEAVARMSPLIILDNPSFISLCGTNSWVLVKSSRAAWAALSALEFGNPQNELELIGITGTNGKSSTAYILRDLLSLHGIQSGLMGTLGNFIGTDFFEATHTTPDPHDLYLMLHSLVRQKIKYAIMEVSSHALDQERLWGLQYSGAAFTSFSQDHLDYHNSMSEYWEAKSLLFKNHLKSDCRILLNNKLPRSPLADSEIWPSSDLWVYGLSASSQSLNIPGALQMETCHKIVFPNTEFACRFNSAMKLEGSIPFFSHFLLENFIAAALLFEKIAGDLPDKNLFSKLSQIPGRMEHVSTVKTHAEVPNVFIDFAHSPDALEKALLQLREFCRGDLWVVFGCGGNRDRNKRPQMAVIAEKHANKVIVTSDNPRNEAPDTIIKEITLGFNEHEPYIIPDRAAAISFAIKNAGPRDVILVAGKGHEKFQIVGNKKIPFADFAVAQDELKKYQQVV